MSDDLIPLPLTADFPAVLPTWLCSHNYLKYFLKTACLLMPPPPLSLSFSPHREEEAIKLDGLSVAEMKQLRDSAEKFVFQAEVNRMMKLIINSLYRNKEVGGSTMT